MNINIDLFGGGGGSESCAGGASIGWRSLSFELRQEDAYSFFEQCLYM